jgi:carboxymethylenebutenolidase
MCFDLDSHPPIAPIAGGALESESLTIRPIDGTEVAAFRARAAHPTGAGIVILPDVRGLHHYYEELALRFAEAGVDALAIDYFARTAKDLPRDDSFEYMPHVGQTKFATLGQDIEAAAKELRRDGRVRSLFTVGFCFGGRLAYLSATLPIHLAGAIGFYGMPVGGRGDLPAPAEVADKMTAPILGLFGGADQGIPPEAVKQFGDALAAAHVKHEIVSYPNTPHSFFDRKAAEFKESSDAAWAKMLEFVKVNTAKP